MTGSPEFEPISVMRGEWGPFAGVRLGRVACYDFPIPEPHFIRPGLPRQDRSYLLLEAAIQLSQPPGFQEEQAGWWYIDLVEISESGTHLTVMDHYLDVIVPPAGHSYRLLDMDEFGDALANGQLSQQQAITGLRNFQRFLDTHLNRRHDVTLAWPDFPPAAIEPLRHWRSALYPAGVV